MRTCLVFLVSAVVAGLASAQERVPDDRAQEIARVLVEHAGKITDAPIKTDADAAKPYGIHASGRAALVIPAKNLSADSLAKAGKEPIAVGQLWMRKIAPILDGKVAPNDKLRILTVKADGEDHALPLLLLGVHKNAKDELELLVYAKGKEPLLRAPLKKIETRQELPIELDAKRNDNDTATLTINILGKYQATLTLGDQTP